MSDSDLAHRQQQLYQAQQSKAPHLTVREMGDVIGISSTSHVFSILDEMVEQGLAEKVKRGQKHVYRILPIKKRGHE
jgi:hypothetical protein